MRWTQLTPMLLIWGFGLLMLLALTFVNHQEQTFSALEYFLEWTMQLPVVGEHITPLLSDKSTATNMTTSDFKSFVLSAWAVLSLAFMLAGRQAMPFIRIVLWPVILFSFITSGSYFYLMLQTRQPEFSPLATNAVKALPSNSVLDFNEQLYASTRYKYFNYRVFSMARRFDQIESGQYQGLTFRHAMLIKYDPDSK